MESQEILGRLKPYLHQVHERRLSDRQFNSLWGDYCEVLKALESLEDLNRLRSELEQEIEEALAKKP